MSSTGVRSPSPTDDAAAVRLSSYVGGEWVEGAGPEQTDRNPARPAEVVATYGLAGEADFERAVAAAESAFDGWRLTPMHERAAVLSRAAALLEADTVELAGELCREGGKTMPESRGEVSRAIQVLRFNAGLADREQGEVFGSARRG